MMNVKNLGMNMKARNNKGFTLVEFLAVLVGIGILTAVVARFALTGTDSAIASEDARISSKVAECIKDSRTGPTFAGLDTEVLIGTRCLDGLNVLNDDRDAIINTYGGPITVETVEFNDVEDLAVQVTSDGYDASQCVKAAQHLISLSPVVNVGGEEVKALGDETVGIDVLTAACETDDTTDVQYLVTR